MQRLSEVLVREWLGPNRTEYDFVCDCDTYDSEANKFLQDGYYASVAIRRCNAIGNGKYALSANIDLQ